MINKVRSVPGNRKILIDGFLPQFWNVKVTSRRPTSSSEIEGAQPDVPAHVEEEAKETPTSLREKQVRMEQQVYRIWT